MMGRPNSNTRPNSASCAQALLNYPPKNSAAGSPGASSNGSGSQAASSSSHSAAGRQRAASLPLQHNQESIRKAPQLDIPEHGLHPGYCYGHGVPVSIIVMLSSLQQLHVRTSIFFQPKGFFLKSVLFELVHSSISCPNMRSMWSMRGHI
jgi:hypothetical protein